jgi:hypothetical protein
MNNEPAVNEKGLNAAFDLAKNHDIDGARAALDVPDEFTDDQLVEALIGLDKGIDLYRNQKQIEALGCFKNAMPIVEASDDEEAKFVIPMLCRFAEGLSALFGGNAVLAGELLNIGSNDIERMSFFVPELKAASFSYKALSLIALARSHLNAADIPAAEKVFGEVREVHDELLKHLDPADDGDSIGFAEVYGTRLELVFLYIIGIDLPSLNLSKWKERLKISKSDKELLEQYIDKIPKGQIQTLLSLYPDIFSVLEDLQRSLEIATIKRRPFNKDEVNALVDVDKKLISARQLVQKSGKRGQGLLFQIDQLSRLQQNILLIAKAATQGFGRFSGLLSFASFVLLIVIMHFTVNPVGYAGTLYYFGALMLSLIVGFGFGALKFQPLLKLFSNALHEKPKGG